MLEAEADRDAGEATLMDRQIYIGLQSLIRCDDEGVPWPVQSVSLCDTYRGPSLFIDMFNGYRIVSHGYVPGLSSTLTDPLVRRACNGDAAAMNALCMYIDVAAEDDPLLGTRRMAA